jgi:DNA-binding GntR family transcriptional regulator
VEDHLMSQPSVFLSKADIARRHIEGLILSRTIKAGDRITTREVSEALGISETPIREAIRSLAAEGWLDVQTHVGAVVAGAGREQLREIYALRGMIGALAIELGGSAHTPKRMAEIDANLSAAAHAVEAKDTQLYTQLNHEFHIMLYDTPHSKWCLRSLVNLSALTTVQYGFTGMPERMAESLKEHKQIVEAIRSGNIDQAAALIKDHEQAAYEALANGLDSGQPVEDAA